MPYFEISAVSVEWVSELVNLQLDSTGILKCEKYFDCIASLED